MTVRTRIAPSPTGFLHIGTLRTVLFDYALAKKNNGQFVVRIEDTDEKRFVEGATEGIFTALSSYGLNPDESINHSGEYGPYIQSQRKEIYKKYAEDLVSKGHAYYCFLEGEELELLQKSFRGKGFRSTYRDQDIEISKKMIAEGKSYSIRLKVPNNEVINYEDGLQGNIKFDSNIVGDEILIKSNGMASYHLAVVVDDFLMKITHVLRGVEWLPSMPKQILVARFLEIDLPPYFHLPVILDPEGGKLSKRKGNVSASQFLIDGYLPEAILNFLMLLGWSSPEKREFGEKEREIYSLQEFIQLFDLADLNKSNAVFNREKLIWFNKEYIKSTADLETYFSEWVKKYHPESSEILSDETLSDKLNLVKERAGSLLDILTQLKFFYSRSENIDWNIKQLDKVKENLSAIRSDLFELHSSFDENPKNWTHEAWEQGIRSIADKYGAKHGDIFMVLRVAIVGAPFSPPLFESLQLMEKKEIVERIQS